MGVNAEKMWLWRASCDIVASYGTTASFWGFFKPQSFHL